MGTKPLYVVKLGSEGYYSASSRWKPVAKEQADSLTHKDALKVMNHMRRPKIEYRASIEPA